jgi:hypothetical protein
MEEETPVSGHLLPQLFQRYHCALTSIRNRNPPAAASNAKRGQTETGSRNARNARLIRRADAGAIFHQTGFAIGLLPKEKEVRLL